MGHISLLITAEVKNRLSALAIRLAGQIAVAELSCVI